MKSIFSAFLGLLFIHLVLLGPLFILQQHRWKESMMQEIKSSLHDFEAEEIISTSKISMNLPGTREEKNLFLMERFTMLSK